MRRPLSAILNTMERRASEPAADRRTVKRGGRRDDDQGKPWYLRQPILLTTAALLFAGWRRVRGGRKTTH